MASIQPSLPIYGPQDKYRNRKFNFEDEKESKCIPCQGRNKNITSWFTIDLEDWEKVKDYKWGHKQGYILNSYFGALSRFLLNLAKGDCHVVDHIDGNPFNNKKSNLRIITYAENNHNKRKREKSTSKFLGVGYCKRDKIWFAGITFKSKYIRVGTFNNEENAAWAYNEKALEFYGQNANLNDLEKPTNYITKQVKRLHTDKEMKYIHRSPNGSYKVGIHIKGATRYKRGKKNKRFLFRK